jgi:uncharacterized protein (DUF488 family)
MATVYTIGHSTRTLEELLAALKGHGITTLVDIRAFPMSRRLPHFNRESLEGELPQRGIAYVWMKELGGRRKKVLAESPNTALRDQSFRNYADYMRTEEFEEGISRVLDIAEKECRSLDFARDDKSNADPSASLGMTSQRSHHGGTAIMCAERVYFHCHRMLVSDYLTAHGHTVLHIDDEKRPVHEHTLMAEARLVNGKLVYDGGRLL